MKKYYSGRQYAFKFFVLMLIMIQKNNYLYNNVVFSIDYAKIVTRVEDIVNDQQGQKEIFS